MSPQRPPGALETPAAAAERDATPGPPACLNCGAVLAGEYCHICGQRDIDPRASLWHVLGEFAQESLELDGRLPRTLLPFLFRPGYLAHEFLEGRRARYTSPVRLYVFIALVSFFLMARATDQAIDDEALDDAQFVVDENGVRAVPEVPYPNAADTDGASGEGFRPPVIVMGDDEAEREALERELADANEKLQSELNFKGADGIERPGIDEDGRLQLPDDVPAGMRRYDGLRPSQAVHALFDALYGWLPIGAIALVFAYAMVLKLFFWRIPLLTHVVASTHVHAFSLLVIAVAATVGHPAYAVPIAFGVINLYVLIGMWRTNGQRFIVTLLKYFGLAVFYGLLLASLFTAVVFAAVSLG